ncbi:MAG TPA: hypothetical protein VJ964_17085 [Balneolaceae bacterium]|nr:hypothetical protein [Balneolaceae bacterium]
MNYIIFLSILNLILFSRLRLILRDAGVSRKDLLIMGGIPLLSLPFLQVNVSWFVLLIYLLAYPFLMNVVERSPEKLNRNRWLILLLHVVVIGILCSPLFNLKADILPGAILRFVDGIMIPGKDITGSDVVNGQTLLFGLLLVLNEMNIVLRYILGILGLKPLASEGEEASRSEYNTGRLIGLLERIFVFLFVLLSQYTAIGFILAAKGVARFQDFKSRTFAEYVLIGTLLSTLLALAIGYFVKLVIQL